MHKNAFINLKLRLTALLYKDLNTCITGFVLWNYQLKMAFLKPKAD